MNLRIFFKASLMCIVVWGIGAGTAGAMTIDAFDSPALGQSVTILNGTAGSGAGGIVFGQPVLGGTRDIEVDIQSVLPGGNISEAEVNTLTSPSDYQFIQSTTVDALAEIAYSAGVAAGLNVDLSGFGGVRLVGVVNDFLTPFTLTLETFGGGSSSVTSSILLGDLDLLFSSLVGTANLQDIDLLSIKIDPPRGGDIKIDDIITIEKTTVPEPTTMLLLGLGLIGLAGMGRKMQR